jgi:hypothetical protein
VLFGPRLYGNTHLRTYERGEARHFVFGKIACRERTTLANLPFKERETVVIVFFI